MAANLAGAGRPLATARTGSKTRDQAGPPTRRTSVRHSASLRPWPEYDFKRAKHSRRPNQWQTKDSPMSRLLWLVVVIVVAVLLANFVNAAVGGVVGLILAILVFF